VKNILEANLLIDECQGCLHCDTGEVDDEEVLKDVALMQVDHLINTCSIL
jgi:hypothetical protein